MTAKPQIDRDGSIPEVLLGRFQIMSAVIGGTYYVADLDAEDLIIRGQEGHICRFETKKDAETFIFSFANHENGSISSTSKPKKWRLKMAKQAATALATKELAAARKAAKAADAALDVKDTKMVPEKATKKITALRASAKGVVVPMKKAAPAKPAVAAKTAKGGNVLPRREADEGSGAYIRRLLKAGYVDTAAILEAVHAQFPGSKAKASDVSWNKGKLKKDEGWVPPAAA